MKYLLFAAIVILSFPVQARENLPPECRLLKDHKPRGDVAYRAGVDARGKLVVPADLNASPVGLAAGQTLVVPLSVDLAKRLQGTGGAGLDMTGTLGFVEIAPDGSVLYNGQDLTGQVHVLCSGQAPDAAPPADGQEAPFVVESAPVPAPSGPKDYR